MTKPFLNSSKLFRSLFVLVLVCIAINARAKNADNPNVVIIYSDDLGYGDVGCYGATKVKTSNIDKFAKEGLRFTDAHCSSATCTPSRFALLTGEYPWRKKGTGILPGDAKMIINPGTLTLPGVFQKAGYKTAAVGKWHLGLGNSKIDWNKYIAPGPHEIGFDYSFLIPATGDRVPCVFVENQKVVGLDPADPILVDYDKKVGNEPTGRENPDLLKMKFRRGHDDTIVNGISRIGFMTGGKTARWVDEDIADVITKKAVHFIEENKTHPFFLYFATHDIHVPHAPNSRFRGTSGCGLRGDAIQEFDWSVGEVLTTLERLKLTDNTLVIVTSDNGGVVNDGYADRSEEDLNGHKPNGALRGGKYSLFEGGTRIPFIARWPGHIKPGTSDALICQVDFTSTFAKLTKQTLPDNTAPDSFDVLPALLGESKTGRNTLVEHGNGLALRKGSWKFIAPGKEAAKNANAERGVSVEAQLYDLNKDLGEKSNVAAANPELVKT
ncbi:MAG: arylsulfatase family protein [Pedosphaera sp.]|nr:arylsulfatase family protein [Pedosphaera sp.]